MDNWHNWPAGYVTTDSEHVDIVEFPRVQEPTPAHFRAMKICCEDYGRHWMNPSAIGFFELLYYTLAAINPANFNN